FTCGGSSASGSVRSDSRRCLPGPRGRSRRRRSAPWSARPRRVPVADLGDLRSRIDKIDGELVRLLAERAEVAARIGERKREAGDAPLDAARERELLERLSREERGRFPLSGLEAIFREILSASRAVQGEFRVGYLGQAGGFA